MIVVLLLSFLSGYSILVLLAATAEYQLSPTQETLLNTADWMVKVSAGAIAGIVIWSALTAIKPHPR